MDKMEEDFDSGRILHVEKVLYHRNKNYIEYLKYVSEVEERVVPHFLQSMIRDKDSLPESTCHVEDPVIYKNPKRYEISEMIKKGVVL